MPASIPELPEFPLYRQRSVEATSTPWRANGQALAIFVPADAFLRMGPHELRVLGRARRAREQKVSGLVNLSHTVGFVGYV